MGHAGSSRSRAVSVSDPRRRAGRPELDYYSQHTGELSESVRWISRGKDRALRRARCETAARRYRDCAQPVEDCGDDPECESVSHGPETVWQFRCVPLEFCRRQNEAEPLAETVSDT